MSAKSQCARILNYLKTGATLSGMEALEKFGCFRLPARIKELRERGIEVKDAWVRSGNKRFKEFYL